MFKKLFNKDKSINNPFATPEVIDRKLEIFKYCKVCNSKLNINDTIKHIKCTRCGTEYNFK